MQEQIGVSFGRGMILDCQLAEKNLHLPLGGIIEFGSDSQSIHTQSREVEERDNFKSDSPRETTLLFADKHVLICSTLTENNTKIKIQ